MPKLRLAAALPVGNLLVAAGLLAWANRVEAPMYVSAARLICRGLSAPAQLVGILGSILWTPERNLAPLRVLGVDSGDLLFLLGVIVLWYIVGRSLDGPTQPRTAVQVSRALLVFSSLVAIAGLLFVAGLDWARRPWVNIGYPAEMALNFAWSGGLFLVGVKGLAKAVLRRRLA